MIIEAKDFHNRQELELHVSNSFGTNLKENAAQGYVIQGYYKDFQSLHLTELTKIFGIPCKLLVFKGTKKKEKELNAPPIPQKEGKKSGAELRDKHYKFKKPRK